MAIHFFNDTGSSWKKGFQPFLISIWNLPRIEDVFTDFNSVKSLAEHIVPIALSFYLGSWSDSIGRKPFIFFCITGSFVASIMNLCNAIYLDEWNR